MASSPRDRGVKLRWPDQSRPTQVRYPSTKTDRSNLERQSLLWSYLVARRIRWNGSKLGQAEIAQRATRFLDDLGVKQNDLADLARAEAVEVSIPFHVEGDGWWWRILPWEYLLTSATRKYRDADLVVIRHLDRQSAYGFELSVEENVALVVSRPGKVERLFKFEREKTMVLESLGTSDDDLKLLETPTLKGIQEKMARSPAGVVHVAGVDSHQGQQLGLNVRREPPLYDGVVLAGRAGKPTAVAAHEFASTLVGTPTEKPRLVVLNLYRSAARIAPLCVAEGASTAIGFQDTFDDLDAEVFLGEFYRTWKVNADPLAAFKLAWDVLGELSTRPLEGSGIVLWSADSLIPQSQREFARSVSMTNYMRKPQGAGNPIKDSQAATDLEVRFKAFKEINYALLHNHQPLYEYFEILNPKQIASHDISIDVELLAGSDPIRCSALVKVSPHPTSVVGNLFVPLTSGLMRSLTEKIRATLKTEVRIGEVVIELKSEQVTLLPINEWVDNDEQRQWLPSFSFPMDPAVRRVVDAAQSHLRVIADTWSIGFDGYQGVDSDSEDPAETVDQQVAALWTAIVQDFGLGYINPPPTYTELSQRLRTPSRVIDNGRGTCIDLALLVSACLEYIGLYPVIFLLQGHAFPGYWRTEEAWYQFVHMDSLDEVEAEGFSKLFDDLDDYPQRNSWVFGQADHESIMAFVERGDLVPIEATWLTANSSLADALDEGWANLDAPGEFEALIDVMAARDADVTPLPLNGGVT